MSLNFSTQDAPEGYTLLLRRGNSVVTMHPTRKMLYDEAFRVLDAAELLLNHKDETR